MDIDDEHERDLEHGDEGGEKRGVLIVIIGAVRNVANRRRYWSVPDMSRFRRASDGEDGDDDQPLYH